MSDIAKKLRDMCALAGDRCDPEFNRALLDAADEMEGIVIRGTSDTPPHFQDSRSDLMWTPPARRIVFNVTENELIHSLEERFGPVVRPEPHPSDMPTFHVEAGRVKEVLRHLKHEASPRFKRLQGFQSQRIPRSATARRQCAGQHLS